MSFKRNSIEDVEVLAGRWCQGPTTTVTVWVDAAMRWAARRAARSGGRLADSQAARASSARRFASVAAFQRHSSLLPPSCVAAPLHLEHIKIANVPQFVIRQTLRKELQAV